MRLTLELNGPRISLRLRLEEQSEALPDMEPPTILTVVIPVRAGGYPEITLRTLAAQTFRDFDVVVSQDEIGNANWARNMGFKMVRSEFVLFSDDDISWEPDAIETLLATLKASPQASYAYGSYEMGGRTFCDEPFDAAKLRRRNYISTMSLIRTADVPGFDQNILRLQDLDLRLTLLSKGKVGVSCGRLIFRAAGRNGHHRRRRDLL